MALFVGTRPAPSPGFGTLHPLGSMRQTNLRLLCEHLGWLESHQIRPPLQISSPVLERFHTADYIAALRAASVSGKVEADIRKRYGFGTMENPLFAGLFERAASTVGGSIHAARLALEVESGGVVFHPAGGTHHGRKDRASGFCYFNDPVFAILTFLDAGLQRVAYIDLDAHHGDGVEAAFQDDKRVSLLSVHEDNRWPYTGKVTDRGDGTIWNMPVARGFHDAELAYLMARVVLPVIKREAPQALVITCGADALAGDPLSGMQLSNSALWRAVTSLVSLGMPTVLLGGGGYNPWTTTRCWAGLWGALSGQDVDITLPNAARDMLNSFECDLVDEEDVEPRWLTHLADPVSDLPVREDIQKLASTLMD